MNSQWSFSALRRALQNAPIQQATSAGWRAYLQGAINTGRVKEKEIQWSGFWEWLEQNEGLQITRTQALAQHALYGVRIQDLVQQDSDIGDSTQYGEYQIGGGTNYREILLIWLPVYSSNTPLFKSSHWDPPNVLAHIRVNDRKDEDGKRILFVEEIQSDWSQLGRQQGVLNRQESREKIQQEKDLDRLQDIRNKQQHSITMLTNLKSRPLYLQATDAERARIDSRMELQKGALSQTLKGIEDQSRRYLDSSSSKLMAAPFISTTDAWLELSIKRITKLAVDEGYARVAFVSSDIVVQRYKENNGEANPGYGLGHFYSKIVPQATKRTLQRLGDYAPYYFHSVVKDRGEAFQGFAVTEKLKKSLEMGTPLFSMAQNETVARTSELFSFAGKSSKLANEVLLKNALTLFEEDASEDRIHFETGWHLGVDGHWRAEISDDSCSILPAMASLRQGGFSARQIASLTYRLLEDGNFDVTLAPPSPKKTSDFITLYGLNMGVLCELLPQGIIQRMLSNEGEPDFIGNFEDGLRLNEPFKFDGINALPLNEVLAHDELFTAYPLLCDVMVQVDPKLGVNASLAIHDDGTQVIRIGLAQQKSNLLHEVQHVIQHIEGFNSGADSMRPHPADLERARVERLRALKENYEGARALHNSNPTRENKEDMKMALQEINTSPTTHNPADQMNAYLKCAGEVEARNTQSRLDWTKAQRTATHPFLTADTKKKQIIFAGRSNITAVMQAVKSVLGPNADEAVHPTNGKVRVVTSAQLTNKWSPLPNRSTSNWGPQAYFEPDTGITYLIADRIRSGSEVAVFLHEMAHKHARAILGNTWNLLHSQVQQWAHAPAKSLERKIFEAAHHKAELSGRYEEELVAYATEAAVDFGVMPSAMNARDSASGWLAWVQQSFESVIAKLTGFKSEPITPRDLVDFVYAAAQAETQDQEPKELENSSEIHQGRQVD